MSNQRQDVLKPRNGSLNTTIRQARYIGTYHGRISQGFENRRQRRADHCRILMASASGVRLTAPAPWIHWRGTYFNFTKDDIFFLLFFGSVMEKGKRNRKGECPSLLSLKNVQGNISAGPPEEAPFARVCPSLSSCVVILGPISLNVCRSSTQRPGSQPSS